MKIAARLLIILPAVALVWVAALNAAEKELITIPLRLFEEGSPRHDLKRADLRLTVNGVESEIAGLKAASASLATPPEVLGRSFVLSFHFKEFSPGLSDAISHFVTEILTNTDELAIVTSGTVFRFSVTPNKGRLIEEIEKVLRTDGELFRQRLQSAVRNVERAIMRAQHRVGSNGDSPAYMPNSLELELMREAALLEFNTLTRQHPLFNISLYKGLLATLEHDKSEKWWIHFQGDESREAVSDISYIAGKGSAYFQSQLARQALLVNIKSMNKVDPQSVEESLQEPFLAAGVRFCALVWDDSGRGESSAPRGDSGSGGSFDLLARRSGGKFLAASDPLEAFRKLSGHRDNFYELAFAPDPATLAGGLTVRIDSAGPGRFRLFHRVAVTPESLEKIIAGLRQQKVAIKEFRIEQGKISFRIDSFNWSEKGNFGLLKIIFTIHGEAGQVFRSANTLRSSKKEVGLSLTVPELAPGVYRARLTAWDMLANELAESELEIRL